MWAFWCVYEMCIVLHVHVLYIQNSPYWMFIYGWPCEVKKACFFYTYIFNIAQFKASISICLDYKHANPYANLRQQPHPVVPTHVPVSLIVAQAPNPNFSRRIYVFKTQPSGPHSIPRIRAPPETWRIGTQKRARLDSDTRRFKSKCVTEATAIPLHLRGRNNKFTVQCSFMQLMDAYWFVYARFVCVSDTCRNSNVSMHWKLQ